MLKNKFFKDQHYSHERIITANRIVLLSIFAFLLYDFIQLNMMNSLSPFILQKIYLTPSQLGLVSSLFFYVDLIFLPVAGFLLDRYQARWLISISILPSIIGLFIFIIWPNKYGIVAWRSLAGISGAFSYLGCIKILATYFSNHRIGMLIGLTGIIIMLAGVIVQFPLIYLLSHIGMINTLLIDAIFGLLVIIALILCIKDHSIYIKQEKSKKFINIKQVYFNKTNWLIAIYACLINSPLFILGALWGNLYLVNIYSLSLKAASLITSFIFIGNMFGAPLIGFASDKINNRKFFMLASAVLFLVSILCIKYTSTSFAILLILFFCLGFATGGQVLAYASTIDLNKPVNIAKATSLLSILSVGGGALAQPLFGWMIEVNQYKNYENGMYLLIFIAIFSCFIAFCLKNLRIRIFDNTSLNIN